jgi:hypothetical protein
MTSPPEPAPTGDTGTAALAAQVATLRGQVSALKTRLDNDVIGKQLVALAEIKRLRSQVTELAQALTKTRDRQRGPAAPYWVGLSPQDHATQLAELRQWTDTILRREYGGYQLPGCWPNHPHAIWELSTLAAEWHRTYDSTAPSLDQALEFHDRWLPGAMRRIADITRRCNPECAARPRALNTAHPFTPPGWQPPAPWGKDPRP